MQWQTRPIVMIDTETTGLHWARHRIIEVAAVRFQLTGDALQPEFLESFQTLINPSEAALGNPHTAEALAINQIALKDLRQAAPFSEIVPALSAFIENTGAGGPGRGFAVSAFNAAFDHPILAAEWLRTGQELPA